MPLIRKILNKQIIQRAQYLIFAQSQRNTTVNKCRTRVVICRQYHDRTTISKTERPENKNIRSYQNGIILTYDDYNLDLSFLWLRDNCRCRMCYNKETFQRNVDNIRLFPPPIPVFVEINNPVLTIKWHDDHITAYNIDWLVQNSYHRYHKDTVDRILWDESTLESNKLPVIPYDEYMKTDAGIKTHLTNILRFGFSILSGAEPHHDCTVEVAKRICYIKETFYGHTWQFTSNNEFRDLSYTTVGLGAHTDNTYFNCPSGLQVFHVVEHTGEGGQTLLVDGFHVAENVRRASPEAFDVLTNTLIPHEYCDEHRKMRSIGTVLRTHPTTGKLIMIRYNPSRRAPLYTLPAVDMERFYESYEQLRNEITSPENEFWIKLKPGTILFADNWRLLHGRAAFTGSRHVSGCYLPHDDWTAKARAMGLLNI